MAISDKIRTESDGGSSGVKSSNLYKTEEQLAQAAARLRRIRTLRAEIDNLNRLKQQYETFQTNVSNLIRDLKELGGYVKNTASLMSKALVIDDVAVGEASMEETSNLANSYASSLSGIASSIPPIINEINRTILLKQSEINRL